MDEQGIRERVAKIPISKRFGFELLELSEGHCVLKVPHDPELNGIYESFHGGLQMTAADSAAAFAVLTLTGAQAPITTTDMNIRFLAKCVSDIRVEARVEKLGRSLVPTQVDIFDAEGKKVAIAQVTYMRLG
ncbi:MAG: PaaI family thioesterase [Planctomycetota bacterium]|jgi:uncharacterized protein (TIGR00369 family)